MRNRRLLGAGLAALVLCLGTVACLGTVIAPELVGIPARAAPGRGAHLFGGGAGGPCGAFPGAHELPGGDGVVPAAWSGGGLVVPACGPAPGAGAAATPVQVIKNGTPHRAPAPGDVLSLSAVPGFDSAGGGHTAVVQSSAVSAAGDGTVTVVEENADAAGVTVLPVSGWTVRDPGFRFAEWLTTTGLTVTSPHPPRATAGERYSFTLTATGGRAPYRWRVAHGALPPGLALSPAGALTGVVSAGTVDGRRAGTWPVTVAVTDTSGATAIAYLRVAVAVAVQAAAADTGETGTATTTGAAGNLRYAEWAWHRLSGVEPAHGGR